MRPGSFSTVTNTVLACLLHPPHPGLRVGPEAAHGDLGL